MMSWCGLPTICRSWAVNTIGSAWALTVVTRKSIFGPVGERKLCGGRFACLVVSSVLESGPACLCGPTLQICVAAFCFALPVWTECVSSPATNARPGNVLHSVLLMLRTRPRTDHYHLAAHICLVRQKHPQNHLSPVRRGRRGTAYGSYRPA